MSRDAEIEALRERFRMQAEQVSYLLDMVSRMAASGQDTTLAEEKLELMEAVLWKHHARLTRLKQHRPVLAMAG